MLSVAAGVFLLSIFASALNNNTFPTCGDCWCVPDNGGTAPCLSPIPQTVFDDVTIQSYRTKIPESIYFLECNPYVDAGCTTTPPQQFVEYGDSAVCAFVYNPDDSENCSKYSLATFPSVEAMSADPRTAYMAATHRGSCGLCSTAQDLSVYLKEDFTSAGKRCAATGLFNETAGLECYETLGLTRECAKIWNYDGIYDGSKCLVKCLSHLLSPNNGPPPSCPLNVCLECDEVLAGPIFSSFGGRTRRRSGLVSEIIRNCSAIASDIVHNPKLGCPSLF